MRLTVEEHQLESPSRYPFLLMDGDKVLVVRHRLMEDGILDEFNWLSCDDTPLAKRMFCRECQEVYVLRRL